MPAIYHSLRHSVEYTEQQIFLNCRFSVRKCLVFIVGYYKQTIQYFNLDLNEHGLNKVNKVGYCTSVVVLLINKASSRAY